jgi:hypothetical protein
MPLHTDNPQDLFILTPKSGNRKVGKGTPVSMSTMSTCPPSCKLRDGCYATCGKLGLVWWKMSEGLLKNGVSFSEFCRRIVALKPTTTIWRHNQAGDLPGSKGRLHKGRCKQLSRANSAEGYNRGGYTYTHYPVLPGDVAPSVARHNAATVKEMNAAGFCVNVSADSLDEADRVADLEIGPVAVLLPASQEKGLRTPAGRPVVVCPAVVDKGGKDSTVNCVDCKLCQRIQRKVIVGFPAHGGSKKKADKLARALDGGEATT